MDRNNTGAFCEHYICFGVLSSGVMTQSACRPLGAKHCVLQAKSLLENIAV